MIIKRSFKIVIISPWSWYVHAKNCYEKEADAKKLQSWETAKEAGWVENEDWENQEITLAEKDMSSVSNEWWIDSGASQHMTPQEKEFFYHSAFEDQLNIKPADDSILLAWREEN